MIESIPPILVAALLGGCVGGVMGWGGNYHIQSKMQKLRNIDDLMKKFYDYLSLSAIYWMSDGKDTAKLRTLEAQMVAAQLIIQADYVLFKNRYQQVNRSYNSTAKYRIELWKATTGGCFQDTHWKPNSDRVRQAAAAITQIVQSFR